MKKFSPSLLGAASCLACLVLAVPAVAQSNVTLTGVVDLSVRHASHSQASVNSLASGGNSTSRLQISGTEDLGGGLVAGFWLEGSVLADTGTGGTGSGLVFDRRSTVQLAGPWGEVRLGRDWTPVFWGQVLADPFLATGIGSIANYLNQGVSTVFRRSFGVQPTTLSRSSNAVEYWLPANLGGWYGQAMWAPSERAGSQSNNNVGSYGYQAFRAGWRNKSVDAALFGGTTRIDAQGEHLRQTGIYGAYIFDGNIRLAASMVDSRFQQSRQSHTLVSLTAPWQQWVFKTSYNHLNQKGSDELGRNIGANDSSSWTLGAEYNLSKRTALYATGAWLNNRGAAQFAVQGTPAGTPAGGSSRGYEFGIRHSF